MVKSSRRKSRTRRSPSRRRRRSPSRRRRKSPSRRRRRSRMEGGDTLRNQYSTAATEAAMKARVIKALQRRRGRRGYEDIQRCLLLIDQAAERFGDIAGDIMLDKLRRYNMSDPDTVGYYCFRAFGTELYQMILNLNPEIDDDTIEEMWDTFYQRLDLSIVAPGAAAVA